MGFAWVDCVSTCQCPRQLHCSCTDCIFLIMVQHQTTSRAIQYYTGSWKPQNNLGIRHHAVLDHHNVRIKGFHLLLASVACR